MVKQCLSQIAIEHNEGYHNTPTIHPKMINVACGLLPPRNKMGSRWGPDGDTSMGTRWGHGGVKMGTRWGQDG